MQLAAVLVNEEGDGHAPRALAADAPVGAASNHALQAGAAIFWVERGLLDGRQRGLAQGFGRFVLGEDAFALIHADKPLRRGAVDDGGFMPPAVRVAVFLWAGGEQAALFLQGLQNQRHGLPDMLAAKQGQLFAQDAIALHGVQDVGVLQAVGDAGIEVIHAIGGG